MNHRTLLTVALALLLLLSRPPMASADGPYPQVAPWSRDDAFTCFRVNPSCQRDPWWMEFWDLSDTRLVGFLHVPGLVSEATFVEAINLIHQWPEGQALLRQAGEGRVRLGSGLFPANPGAAGAYRPVEARILINPSFLKTSTWMLAGLLVHELQHAADDRAGWLQDCYAAERKAYSTQRRYLGWLTGALVRQPIPMHLVNQHLSGSDRTLAYMLVRIASAPSLDQFVAEDFAAICGSRR